MAKDFSEKALSAGRESKHIEFKGQFEDASPGSKCEIIKDIVALANSGGGSIVIGLDDRGNPTKCDCKPFLEMDPADLSNSILKYVGEAFDDFEIFSKTKNDEQVVVLNVGPKTESPLVFENPGTYKIDEKQQKTAFARGTIYFRHGAKSEPATSADLSRFIKQELSLQRKELLANVKKISVAPRNSKVIVVSPTSGPRETVERFRVVDDPDAPALARTDYDVTHPFRQKELIETINERIGHPAVTSYSIQSLRRIYDIDDRPEFFHRPKFSGSPQFSDALVSWLITEYQTDNEFFHKAIAEWGEIRRAHAK